MAGDSDACWISMLSVGHRKCKVNDLVLVQAKIAGFDLFLLILFNAGVTDVRIKNMLWEQEALKSNLSAIQPSVQDSLDEPVLKFCLAWHKCTRDCWPEQK